MVRTNSPGTASMRSPQSRTFCGWRPLVVPLCSPDSAWIAWFVAKRVGSLAVRPSRLCLVIVLEHRLK